jgi:hypothetical protein
MSVFICWSGGRSHAIANALKTLLLQTLRLKKNDVFISDSIEKGANWFNAIERELERAEAGVVCLTAENLTNPWLHFEAGALGNRLARLPKSVPQERRRSSGSDASRRLFTLLHGVTGAELKGPLSAYQSTLTTKQDVDEMMLALARVLDRPATATKKARSIVTGDRWQRFERKIGHVAVPARNLVSLDVDFDRKTFNEPLYCCTDQAWVRRYDGVVETLQKLLAHEPLVEAACSPKERSIYTMLLVELNGYAMAMQSLLLRPRKFDLTPSGELQIDAAIRTCCEDRRLAIKSLVTLLLHPVDEPLREEAVRFMEVQTNAERKMIVHNLEGMIRRHRETVFERSPRRSFDSNALQRAVGALTAGRMPVEFRASSWDLDRIFYYLLVQYFTTGALRSDSDPRTSRGRRGRARILRDRPLEHHWLCAARDVEMEVERYRAKSKGGSLMPLTYALCALQELHPERAGRHTSVTSTVQTALDAVDQELGRAPASDATPIIQQLVANMRSSRRAVRPRTVNRAAQKSMKTPAMAFARRS